VGREFLCFGHTVHATLDFKVKLSKIAHRTNSRCGFRPASCQTRCTTSLLIPSVEASLRQLQCVDPCAKFAFCATAWANRLGQSNGFNFSETHLQASINNGYQFSEHATDSSQGHLRATNPAAQHKRGPLIRGHFFYQPPKDSALGICVF
jgi:hypothetical protein